MKKNKRDQIILYTRNYDFIKSEELWTLNYLKGPFHLFVKIVENSLIRPMNFVANAVGKV